MTEIKTEDERVKPTDGRAPTGQALAVPAEPASGLDPSGFDPSRVLFLDIDGVVLSGQELWRSGNNRYLPPAKIALIREVCERAGAVVVVSSTWRYSDETLDRLRFEGIPVHADWRTPQPWREGALFIATGRGTEIHRWLARHPEVSAYAIVDDDSDMLPEQMSRFVRTPFETGIDREHVERLVSLLRDSDEHRNGEDPEGLSGEAMPARAEGIAQPDHNSPAL